MARLPHGRASFKQLARELGVKGPGKSGLDDTLRELVERGDLIELRSGYALTSMSREFTSGVLRMHRDGYGFVVPDRPVIGMTSDLFIPPESAGRAMHGDKVLARIVRIEATGRADGEVLRVLKRGHVTVVGEFIIKRQGCFVKPHDDRLQQWIEIPEGMEMPASRQSIHRVGIEPRKLAAVEDLDGLIVNVEIVDFPEHAGESPVGRVIEVLGHPDDFGIDVEVIIRKFHIPHQFPPSVLEQASSFGQTIPAEEIASRRDFRDLQIVTIDGETARDFDDAVWVDRLPNGNYALHVHIADVSYYVRPGSPIDREAAMRGTSVYFPDRAVPMLPVELSTELCSLKPQVDRLVLSALMELDPKGDVVRQEFVRGVIRSAERMTYTGVWGLLEGDTSLRERYAPLVERFELMGELAKILNRRRMRRGSIDFDMPEAVIEFDPDGQMTGVKRAPRNFAHRIIEEFMLSANEAVASHLSQLEFPSIYRIHEQPAANRLADFEEIASSFGYSLVEGAGVPSKKFRTVTRHRDGRKSAKETKVKEQDFTVSSRAYQKLVARLQGQPEERILTYLMLRSLKQAKYSEVNKGHFALAAPMYTHFTSPIRRYPDLIVHRVLGTWLQQSEPQLREDRLRVIADECSTTERRADEAERELVEWKKAKFMEDHVGEQFKALVISTTRFGFFVELEQYFVEGLVPIETIPGDRYHYSETTRRISGDRTKLEFAIGDHVDVVLDRVEPMDRKLQFSLVEPERERRKKRRRE
ncbi:MAG: VacB/RNase II family 3'-5' exoribonuclease [Bryobacteraceae bacterium]|nr:VacB/RNase II family 3'-5' exoribonuclease [Bryobacteraceae bacterium]